MEHIKESGPHTSLYCALDDLSAFGKRWDWELWLDLKRDLYASLITNFETNLQSNIASEIDKHNERINL